MQQQKYIRYFEQQLIQQIMEKFDPLDKLISWMEVVTIFLNTRIFERRD